MSPSKHPRRSGLASHRFIGPKPKKGPAVTRGGPTQLTITTQPSALVTTSVAFAQQPVIQVRDASNNPVSQSGVVVTAVRLAGVGALAGTLTAVTNGAGVATFANLAVADADGHTDTIQFSAPGLTPVTSVTITVASGVVDPTPDILNNASFETGWDGFTSWSPPDDPTNVTRDNTLAYDGSTSVCFAWTPNP